MINKKRILKLTLISLLCFDLSSANDGYYDHTKPSFYGDIFYNGGLHDKNQLVKGGTAEYKFNPVGGGIGFIYDTGQNIRLELEGIFSSKQSINAIQEDSQLTKKPIINFNKSYMSGMMNAYYNIHSDYQVSSYFGFGIGLSNFQFSDAKVGNVDYDAKFDSLNAFTVQAKAGIIMTGLSDHLMPYIGYKLLYFTGKDIIYKHTGSGQTERELKIGLPNGLKEHNLQVGVLVPLNINM
jgi:opacity protein-like surface antigen